MAFLTDRTPLPRSFQVIFTLDFTKYLSPYSGVKDRNILNCSVGIT